HEGEGEQEDGGRDREAQPLLERLRAPLREGDEHRSHRGEEDEQGEEPAVEELHDQSRYPKTATAPARIRARRTARSRTGRSGSAPRGRCRERRCRSPPRR